jgi:hypothetical protein
MKKELLEKILTKLVHDYAWFESNRREIIAAIEAELAKPDIDPVAYVDLCQLERFKNGESAWCHSDCLGNDMPLYTSPPSRDNSHTGRESFNDGVLFAEKHHKIGQKTMIKYILDCTNIDPSHKLYGLKIRLKKGEHDLDFDVDECDLPRGFRQSMVDNRIKNLIPIPDMSIPIGVDLARIWEFGAKIIRIEP